MTELKWGILGLGNIARAFARGLAGSQSGRLVAVGSRTQDSADRFGTEFEVDKRYPSYEQLLADREVEAVYVATPHPLHPEWVFQAAAAGKHILCEKPLAINQAQAMAMIDAAVRHDVFLMEAFMYRCHPQTQKLVDLVRDGAVGQVRAMQGSFAFNAGFNPEGRLFSQALGGGGILDVGCYPVSMARLIAGTALGSDFAEPEEVHAVGHLCPTGVDGWTFAALKFADDIIAQVGTGVQVGLDNTFTIFGSEGKIALPSPWLPARDGGQTTIQLSRSGQTAEEIEVTCTTPLYGVEADTVARHIDARQAPSPAMSWADTLGNMATLDRWRAAIGCEFDAEKPAHQKRPAHGRPLARRPDHTMRYAAVPGVDKQVSRLVLGCDNQTSMPHAAAMFDGFFEAGGNTFDTAYIYGGGQQEKLLGWWIRNRGIRDQVVLISKGAHSPNCFPEKITSQLHESLERLQTERADIYFMHRDNPEVPVGEFVDVLCAHQEAGRIGAFGGSNWSIERVREANAYAARTGKTGFAALSNNFSLARMVEPVWGGCLAASDPAYRSFLAENQLCLLPWSSQARGFFLGRAHPEERSNEELVRCWYSDDNFQRLERVYEMARERAVLPINIALAYVLCQPFPTFPLIGPRTLEELRTSLPALDLQLSPEELRWLNLED